MLDDIFRARNLRVVSRRDLLGRLLGTLREQARIARRQQKQLLIIFVFAHGETKASGVSVGGERRHASAPILHMDAVNRLLPRDVSASLLITSCFSGGWLFRPDLTSSPGYFNVPVLPRRVMKRSHTPGRKVTMLDAQVVASPPQPFCSP